ncbi:MAG TPA: TldD/PmbA family protein [Spirochaetaceae bacterium]|nr:TldD/PmbA family protein [Spirochaetaceae bacterium]HAW87016.1 TldD/PmbA family protein [Spirochaetaceae bacterium]HAX38499.1 TldD/PmbA family protein [Spirochaetaceae bacterium]HBO41920.1 TldD/PmbA family protein [Spirochaetaceae bacterium]HCQ88390.1 TldD/PmbA family protein [Spirochaetaceae bacterium]
MAIVRKAVAALRAAGADQATASFGCGVQNEMNIDAGKLSLYRSTVNVSLSLTALTETRKGSVSLNKYDDQSIEAAAAEAVSMARSSQPDPANDISPARPLESFEDGQLEPDSDKMYERLQEFIAYCQERYPITHLEQCVLDFSRGESFFANSNGAEFEQRGGLYNFSAMFTSKDGGNASSFNYSGAVQKNLDQPLKDWGSIDLLMRQSTEQTVTQPVQGNFSGDLLIAPDCLGDFLGMLDGVYTSDYPIITGTSPWAAKLGQAVTSPQLTVRSLPNSPELAANSPYTGDGFRTEDCLLIEKGVLRNFSIGLYAANKSGRPRCPSGGGGLMVDPGELGWQDMVKSIERGLLLMRFSGGSPSDSGDFSGVAKNSYLIEQGKIVRPIGETMIAGNLAKLFSDVKAISRERVNYGSAILPWLQAGPADISGK